MTVLPSFKSTRSRLKRSVVKRSKCKVRNAESLVWMNFMLMMHRLAAAAEQNAKEERQGSITRDNILAVEKELLKSCKF